MPNTPLSSWVHIPVHRAVRELDAKLLLAVILVSEGFNVTIGRTASLRKAVDWLPKGIYIDVRFLKTRREVLKQYLAAGHKVVAFDEEAPSFPSKTYYQEHLVDHEVLGLLEAAFCWGPFHAEVVKECLPENLVDRVVATGHPRFDIMRPEPRRFYDADVAKLRKRYGRFFLLNSNAGGWVLDRRADTTWQNYVDRGIIADTSKNKAAFYAKFDYRYEKHGWLAEVAAAIAKNFPDHRLVIRPHFTETKRQWERWLPNTADNISIIHEGNSLKWILASEAVLHNSCTTGTEAFLANVPVIAYRPKQDKKYDAYLPNALSAELDTIEAVCDRLRDVVDGKDWNSDGMSKRREEVAKQYICGRKGAMASEHIAQILREITIDHDQNSVLVHELKDRANAFAKLQSLRKLNRLGRRAIHHMVRGRNDGERYISLKDVNDRLEHLHTALPKRLRPRISQIESGIFALSPAAID